MNISEAQLFEVCQQALRQREAGCIKDARLNKSWVLVLSRSLPVQKRIHVQRRQIESPLVLVSFDYFSSIITIPAYNGKQRIALKLFDITLTEALRYAVMMARTSVFEQEEQAVDFERKEHQRRSASKVSIVDEHGLIERRYFIVNYIVAVTEVLTEENTSTTVMQSPQFPTLSDMIVEGRRILSEKILNKFELGEIQEREVKPLDSIPSSVTFEMEAGQLQKQFFYTPPDK